MTFPWQTQPAVEPTLANRISRRARGDIFDWMSLNRIVWAGRLEDPDFLGRLYDLEAMPSISGREPSAFAEIYRHTVSFRGDWDLDWVYGDERFNLRGCSDKEFLNFLVETVHPNVRPRPEDATRMVQTFNSVLAPSGFGIFAERQIGDAWVYGWRELDERRRPTETRMAEHPQFRDRDVLKEHLDRIEEHLVSDPASAIDSCKNLLESLCKAVIAHSGQPVNDRDTLPALFNKASAVLEIDKRSVPGNLKGSDALQRAMGALTTVISSIAETRNAIGDGHGGLEVSAAEPRHARLVFNATTAAGEFILDSWI